VASRLVYTAITGGHAQLSARPTCPDTDFVCFTDRPEAYAHRNDWQILPAATAASPRMAAKWHKLHPPPSYTWTLWADGAYVLGGSQRLVDDLIAASPSGFGLHKHHWFDCLYDEAVHAQELPKCAGIKTQIAAQAGHYRKAGHPKHWGLWAGGLMCRSSSPLVAEVMRRWWDEIERWTWRDQMSLPIALRGAGVRPDTWRWPLFHCPHFPAWHMNPS
jgi:Protein of unknown function (DUF616)